MKVLKVSPVTRIEGITTIPGDKSISHRAAIIGSIANGATEIEGYLESKDCLNTLKCLSELGVRIEKVENGLLKVFGKGLFLNEPNEILNVGNSGTSIRLLAGILAGQPFYSVITGDDSIRQRPMKRIVSPLCEMGATILGRKKNTLAPLTIKGGPLRSISYSSEIASAQVKSCVLLAGLYADGVTSFSEPLKSRDHTERMLRFFGAEIQEWGTIVSLNPRCTLTGRSIKIPGDISSAAFFIVAGILLPNSDLLIEDVGINPTRSGCIGILLRMGASIEIFRVREEAGEPVGDIRVRSSSLHGITIGPEDIPSAIDEIPILSLAAAFAEGETLIKGADELRKKESDRIAAIVRYLRDLGVDIIETDDGMIISGGVSRLKGGAVQSSNDHRIAMSAAIAGLVAEEPVIIQDAGCIEISFPGFDELLFSLTK